MSGLSDFEDDSTELEQEFAAAAKHLERLVGTLDQPSLLQFYGLYKQATVGPCNVPKPGLFALQAKAKWNAWNDLQSLASDAAMQRYVDKMSALQPEWRGNNDTAGGTTPKEQWVAVSRLTMSDAPLDDAQKTCADFVKEGNLERSADLLRTIADVNALDDGGLALIHWAADRGSVAVLRTILAAGADVNRTDADGQTALHYACSVGHADCVQALLEAGAERNVVDAEGVTCAEVAACSEIRALVDC